MPQTIMWCMQGPSERCPVVSRLQRPCMSVRGHAISHDMLLHACFTCSLHFLTSPSFWMRLREVTGG